MEFDHAHVPISGKKIFAEQRQNLLDGGWDLHMEAHAKLNTLWPNCDLVPGRFS